MKLLQPLTKFISTLKFNNIEKAVPCVLGDYDDDPSDTLYDMLGVTRCNDLDIKEFTIKLNDLIRDIEDEIIMLPQLSQSVIRSIERLTEDLYDSNNIYQGEIVDTPTEVLQEELQKYIDKGYTFYASYYKIKRKNYHSLINDNLSNLIKKLNETKVTPKTEQTMQTNKIKWKQGFAEIGMLLELLESHDFIEVPEHSNGKTNNTELAKKVLACFEFTKPTISKQPSVDSLRKAMADSRHLGGENKNDLKDLVKKLYNQSQHS